MKSWALFLAFAFLAGCASRSVLPDAKAVVVSRNEAKKSCKDLGTITGVNPSAKQDGHEKALEDLKREAANKGANYVVVKQYSGYGTAVTGIAYECP